MYDISQAVADGATVRIYYESRLAKVNFDEEGKRLIEEFDAELEQNPTVPFTINDAFGTPYSTGVPNAQPLRTQTALNPKIDRRKLINLLCFF